MRVCLQLQLGLRVVGSVRQPMPLTLCSMLGWLVCAALGLVWAAAVHAADMS